jgi:DNA (cytosine-5)-methyltransferase 1
MKAIDLFAGGGGFTTGAAQAGANVIWAANHSPHAVQCHSTNHPEAMTICQDLQQADWSKVPSHDLCLASPCCQGHAHARGKDQPHHDASRSTAWAVVACCEYHRPKAVIIENVPEYLSWPLYPAWKLAMETLGYEITTTILDAADVGVPQHRERMFLVGSRVGAIDIPTPNKKHVPVSSILDFDSGRWSPVVGHVEATVQRWENGRREFGRRFVMPYYGSGSGLTGRSLDRPLGTVTTRDRWAVVDGDNMRMMTVAEYKAAMGFPASYKLPKVRKTAIHLLGNAVCPPAARYLVSHVQRSLMAVAA